MLKFILLVVGLILVFEGLIYFFLASKIKFILKMVETFSVDKIKFVSTLIVIIGSCIVYFTFWIYEFN
tara:strand:+ start:3068 stop:3271 length:204 start_codon:yes stop_codon:yes gene_type:complete